MIIKSKEFKKMKYRRCRSPIGRSLDILLICFVPKFDVFFEAMFYFISCHLFIGFVFIILFSLILSLSVIDRV